MTRSTLFGYTVEKEEDDDSVVITVSGPMARTFLRCLADDPRNRHGTGLLPAPLPWRALGSRSVEISIGRERQPNGADDSPISKTSSARASTAPIPSSTHNLPRTAASSVRRSPGRPTIRRRTARGAVRGARRAARERRSG